MTIKGNHLEIILPTKWEKLPMVIWGPNGILINPHMDLRSLRLMSLWGGTGKPGVSPDVDQLAGVDFPKQSPRFRPRYASTRKLGDAELRNGSLPTTSLLPPLLREAGGLPLHLVSAPRAPRDAQCGVRRFLGFRKPRNLQEESGLLLVGTLHQKCPRKKKKKHTKSFVLLAFTPPPAPFFGWIQRITPRPAPPPSSTLDPSVRRHRARRRYL